MSKSTLIISIDLESDVGCSSPANSNMWELGLSFIEAATGTEIDSYQSYIKPRKHIQASESTMNWMKSVQLADCSMWDKYIQIRFDPATPEPDLVMYEIGCKLEKYAENYEIVWAAFPACFDWMYFRTYWDMYASASHRSLVGYNCKCISGALNTYASMTKTNIDELWKQLSAGIVTVSHQALDDARVQGHVYVKLLKLL